MFFAISVVCAVVGVILIAVMYYSVEPIWTWLFIANAIIGSLFYVASFIYSRMVARTAVEPHPEDAEVPDVAASPQLRSAEDAAPTSVLPPVADQVSAPAEINQHIPASWNYPGSGPAAT